MQSLMLILIGIEKDIVGSPRVISKYQGRSSLLLNEDGLIHGGDSSKNVLISCRDSHGGLREPATDRFC